MLSLPCAPAGERLGHAAIDVLMCGDQVGGFRPSVLSEELQQRLAGVTSHFLGTVTAKGAGCFTFGLSGGEPVLLGLQMGEACRGRGEAGRCVGAQQRAS
jgi:hypothetical protein